MRCKVVGGRYRGKFGTIKGSTFDEESRKYCREVVLDGKHFEELINVKHLRALTEGEWFLELTENDKREWTDCQRRFEIGQYRQFFFDTSSVINKLLS